MPKLTDAKIANYKTPAEGYQFKWDADGLGVRLSYTGARAFVLDYVANGKRRRMVLKAENLADARVEASTHKAEIKKGADPLDEKHEKRQAVSERWRVRDLADDYLREHADVHKRPRSAANDRMALRKFILPSIGDKAVADVTTQDIERIVNGIARGGHPVGANRVRALLSTMFNRAVMLKQRPPYDNPARDVRKFHEQARKRYLSADETVALMKALDEHPNQRTANAIRLLYLTGARRGEVLTAKWSELDLERGVWTKPSAHTKQKETHTMPLNGAALTLLREMKASAHPKAEYLFPHAYGSTRPLRDIRVTWASVLERAAIQNLHLHDLRHSFASVLLARGVGLEVIGGLLGHVRTETTQRYSHLLDGTMREATERLTQPLPAIAGAGK